MVAIITGTVNINNRLFIIHALFDEWRSILQTQRPDKQKQLFELFL